jgi:hypothetical protein
MAARKVRLIDAASCFESKENKIPFCQNATRSL